jgi:hypothetical protein
MKETQLARAARVVNPPVTTSELDLHRLGRGGIATLRSTIPSAGAHYSMVNGCQAGVSGSDRSWPAGARVRSVRERARRATSPRNFHN